MFFLKPLTQMSNLQNLANLAIERLRKEKKLSREDMAHHLDISLEAYRKIENGTTNLSLDRLEQICEVLETDILEMLASNNAKYQVNEVKDRATGINIGTINHPTDSQSLYDRIDNINENTKQLTLAVTELMKLLPAQIESLALLLKNIKT